MQKIIIAIDGHSSCGKTTLSKELAMKLGYTYISSGAMYRAITLYFIQHGIDINNPEAVEKALKHITIQFDTSGQENRTLLNGTDVEDEIKEMYVSQKVSPVSAISAVRRFLVLQQRAIGAAKGIVMDGRDIGTVVFPDAELKIFLTASVEERVRRRFEELKMKGIEASPESVRENLISRDHIDSTREDSPLKKADDAIVIDNTFLTPEEQLDKAYHLALEIIKTMDE
ncbi:MAG: (d)CMP kinase [Saprospiraceae bacterium]|nr:(d)CMP kinase [Saprospiraceae bacterium]MCB9325980.1 (d)CMP kinase [Lewinellaceae bacterium]